MDRKNANADAIRLARALIQLIITLALALAPMQATSANIYKYKNAQGKWVFTDKKPQQHTQSETLNYKSHAKERIKPIVFATDNGQIAVQNPFYAPVELQVHTRDNNTILYYGTIAANSSQLIYQSDAPIPEFGYRWIIGDPKAHHLSSGYALPFLSSFEREISQAFNGNYSHTSKGSKYAVDIALPVGTPLVAARAGTVISTNDDYVFSGQAQYFLDKANKVEVLHDDGSYAVYAHLLQSSLAVKVGDKVQVGDVLGKSGSSGYSTGPHLHFVIRKNTGFNTVSVPFSFIDQQGQKFTPKAGMRLSK